MKNTKKYTLEIEYGEKDDVIEHIRETVSDKNYEFDIPRDPTMYNKCIVPLMDTNLDAYFIVLDTSIACSFVIGDA